MTEFKLKSLLMRKKRDGRQLGRTELNWLCKLNWLCRQIWRKRRALKRKKHLNKNQGKCGDKGKPPRKHKASISTGVRLRNKENSEKVPTDFFQDFCSVPTDQEDATQSEQLHWVELWRNLRMGCAGGLPISPKKLERALNKLKKR